MSYLSNPGDNLTAQQQTILNTYIALATTPAGQHLAKDASGNFVNTPDTTGASSAGGSNTQLQYNNGGALGGIAGMTYNGTKLNVLSSTLEVSDNVDTTKKVALALNTISTGTTITLTVPNQSGTVALLTDIPKITQVLDTNGNKILTFTTTASAVNYLDIKDNATTFSPTISAQGTDANIDINLVPKGNGRLKENGVNLALDTNVIHLTGNETVDGVKTFLKDVFANGLKINNVATPIISLKTSQAGTREFLLASAFSDANSISIVDITANAERLKIDQSGTLTAKLNAPQGFMLNGKIVTSVSSGTLTVAIKTLAGNDPSATDPVYVRIGDTVRTLTQSASISPAAGGSWCNLNSAELQNQEVDLFVYLGYSTTANRVVIGASRIPFGRVQSDFSATSSNERFLMEFIGMNGSDELEVVGRFNAILSNTAQWSIPATPVIINRPIYETRQLSFTSQAFASGGGFSIGNGSIESSYLIAGKMVHLSTRFNCGSTTNLGSGQISFTFPIQNNIGGFGIQLRTLGGGSGAAYNGSTTYPVTPVTNFYNSNGGMMFATPDTSNSGFLGASNPFAWGAGCYAGAGFSYNLI